MPERYANNFATTLASGINPTATTITVGQSAPTELSLGEFRIIIDSEILRVTGGQTTTTWTVERGRESTVGASHVSGAPVTHVLTAHSVRLLSEELWLTDPRIGITMNRTGFDQGPLLQTAIDLALTGDGVLRLNPGVVENHSIELTYTQNDKILFIIGSGCSDNETSGSTLRYHDLGVGKYALRPVYGAYGVVWRDFNWMGPQTRNTFGSDVSDMWGPRIHGRSLLERVNSVGFKTGMYLSGDHHESYQCKWRGNSFGLYMGDNVGGGGGDMWYIGVHVDGNRKASVGVGTSTALANFTFLQGHSGFSPYGLYRFEEGLAQRFDPWLQGGDFIQHSWEACGNGVIFDEPGDGTITDVRFANVGQMGEPSFAWPGKSYPARGLWDVGTIERVQVTGDIAPGVDTGQGIDIPWIYALVNVNGIEASSAVYTGHTVFASPGHKLITCPFIDDVYIGPMGGRGGRGICSTVANCAEAIGQFDAVELMEDGRIQKARNTNPYLGNIVVAASTNTSGYVVTNGRQGNWVRGKVSENVVTGDRLVVDPANPGYLKKGGSLWGVEVVARALESITGGNNGQIKITGSQV